LQTVISNLRRIRQVGVGSLHIQPPGEAAKAPRLVHQAIALNFPGAQLAISRVLALSYSILVFDLAESIVNLD